MEITTKLLLMAAMTGFFVRVQGMENALVLSMRDNEVGSEQDQSAIEKTQRESILELNRMLFAVLEANDAEKALQVIAQGAEVNAKNYLGMTPFQKTVKYGHLKVCQLLLGKGADVNAKFNDGFAPLCWAARSGHLEVCQLLLEEGAEVNAKDAKDNNGLPPLYWAAVEGHLKVCQLLLEKGAEVNAKDGCGMNPLHRTAENGHLEVCQMLLENGADVKAKDSHGRVPFDLAQTNCRPLIGLAACDISIMSDESCESLSNNTTELEFWQSALPYACLRCPSKDEVQKRRACLREALLCMKSVCSNVPRDIRLRILCVNEGRVTDFMLVPEYVKQVIKSYLRECYEKAENPELKAILDPEALESNFGKVITENIHTKLDALQQKAHENSKNNK